MATKKIWLPRDIYQIKVILGGTRLPIWRRLPVPSGFTLEDLYSVVQAAMGWDDSHLHKFRIGQKRFGKSDPSEQLTGMDSINNERTTHPYTVLGKVSATAMYTYDFGDGWEHALVVEKMLLPDRGVAYPSCAGGKLQGPLEDCGGIPGYYHLLEAIRDPNHPEHQDLLDWVGGEYDPKVFSVDEINRRLAPIQRWWSKSLKEAASPLILVADDGIRVETNLRRELRHADWKALIIAPVRRCMECLGQYSSSAVTADRESCLDDPASISGLSQEHPLRMTNATLAIFDPGRQVYHFVPSMLDEPLFDPCKTECPYPLLAAKGDAAGLIVTGRGIQTERVRRRRRAARHSIL